MKLILTSVGGRTEEIETRARTIAMLLKELGINPDTVIVRRNSGIRTADTKLGDGDRVEIIPVVSGG